MTLESSAYRAVRPWFSADADDLFSRLPQQEIDFCLMCSHHASACDKCDGHGNLSGSAGRPRKQLDTAMLREMMRLRRCNREVCAALGISEGTLKKAKKEILKEETL